MMLKPYQSTREVRQAPAGDRRTPDIWTSLDRWVRHDWAEGVHLTALEEFQQLRVCTRNSLYELIVMSRGGEVRVRGGRYFPDWTAAHLAGSSAGGSLLKSLGIYLGLRMEIEAGGRRIVTSPVHSIIALKT